MNRDEGGFGFWISVLNRTARTYFQKELQHLHIGPGQQAYILSLQPGEEIAQEELADRLRVNRANVTRAVQRLVARGYIKRKRKESDMREWQISLSEEGIRVRSEVERIAQVWIEHLKQAVTQDEWQSLERSLRKIALFASTASNEKSS